MTTLHILFNGSPDFPALQRFVGVADEYNNELLNRQATFTRWKVVQRKLDLWALEVNSLPLRRSEVVFVCGAREFTDQIAAEAASFARLGVITLTPEARMPSDDFDVYDRLERLDMQKVELADRLFIVNPEGVTDEQTDKAITRATLAGKQVSYLVYI